MASDYTLKQNDTWPPLVATLSDIAGPLDLTDADTIRLILRSRALVITTAPVEIVDPASSGQVTYTFTTADTRVAGDYSLEFEITWNNGGIETVPNDSYLTITIVEDLG
jgi:hypothetical protein